MRTHVYLLIFLLCAAALQPSVAQTTTAPKATSVASAGTKEQFVMHNGEVMLQQGSTTVPLTRNIVLPNGTKVNYKSGIVEFTTGKKATLQEGDYVTLNGDVIIATPEEVRSRNNTLPADGRFNLYVDKDQKPSTQANTVAPATNELPVLLTRKIQLLNDKISLMVPDPAKQDAINKINEQLLSLDSKIGR